MQRQVVGELTCLPAGRLTMIYASSDGATKHLGRPSTALSAWTAPLKLIQLL